MFINKYTFAAAAIAASLTASNTASASTIGSAEKFDGYSSLDAFAEAVVPDSVSLVGGAFCSITDDSGEESGCALLAVRTGGTGYDIVLTDEVCEGTSLVTGCIGGYRTALISQHVDEVIEDKSAFVETDIWLWDDESGKMALSKTMEVSLSRGSGVTHLLVSEYDDLGVLISEVEGSVDDDGDSADGSDSSGGAEAQSAAEDFFYGAAAAVGTMAAGAALVGAAPVSVTTVAVVAVAGGAFGAWAGSGDDEEAPPADGGGSGDCGDGGGDSGGSAEPQSESEDCNPEEPEVPVDPDQDLFEDCNPEVEDCDDEGSTDDLFDDSITDDLVLSTF